MDEMTSLHNMSEWLYSWLLDATDENWLAIFANQPDGGYGQSYLVIFLLLTAIATPLIFYFIIAKNAANATKKNYITLWLLGYFCLVVMNYFGLAALTDSKDVFMNFDMIKVTLIDFIYYSVIYELISYFSKESKRTMANNIDLITCWK